MRPTREQVILVTGATDGLGRALAGELAGRGATMLLHGRDERRLADTIDEIRAQTHSEKLRAYGADFSSLQDVGRTGRADRARSRPDRRAGQQRGDRLHAARRRPADGEPRRSRAALRGQLPGALPADATARVADPSVRAGPDRQRELRRPGGDRLRRRDARASLRRHARVLPEQARPDHVHIRPRRRASRRRGHRQLPAPGDSYMPTKIVHRMLGVAR